MQGEYIESYEDVSRYLYACEDRDADGFPATSVFNFGYQTLAAREEGEEEGEVESVTATVPVHIREFDDLIFFKFDFSQERTLLTQLFDRYKKYSEEADESKEMVARYSDEIAELEKNNDEQAKADLLDRLMDVRVPFITPCIIPSPYEGRIYVYFDNEPSAFVVCSEDPMEPADQLLLVYNKDEVLIEDEGNVYAFEDDEEEEDERKKMEEEAYLRGNEMYYADEEEDVDTTPPGLKGVRGYEK